MDADPERGDGEAGQEEGQQEQEVEQDQPAEAPEAVKAEDAGAADDAPPAEPPAEEEAGDGPAAAAGVGAGGDAEADGGAPAEEEEAEAEVPEGYGEQVEVAAEPEAGDAARSGEGGGDAAPAGVGEGGETNEATPTAAADTEALPEEKHDAAAHAQGGEEDAAAETVGEQTGGDAKEEKEEEEEEEEMGREQQPAEKPEEERTAEEGQPANRPGDALLEDSVVSPASDFLALQAEAEAEAMTLESPAMEGGEEAEWSPSEGGTESQPTSRPVSRGHEPQGGDEAAGRKGSKTSSGAPRVQIDMSPSMKSEVTENMASPSLSVGATEPMSAPKSPAVHLAQAPLSPGGLSPAGLSRRQTRQDMLAKFDWSLMDVDKCVSEEEEQLFPVVYQGQLMYLPWDELNTAQQRAIRLPDIQDERLRILEASMRLQAWSRGRRVRLEMVRNRAEDVIRMDMTGYKARSALDRVAQLEQEYAQAKEFYDRMQGRISAMFRGFATRKWYYAHKAELQVLRAQRLMLRDRRMRKARVEREVAELNNLIDFSSKNNEGALVSIFVPQQRLQTLPTARSPPFNPPRCAAQIPFHQQYHGHHSHASAGAVSTRPATSASAAPGRRDPSAVHNPLRASTPYAAAPPVPSRAHTPQPLSHSQSRSHASRPQALPSPVSASPPRSEARSGARNRKIRDQAAKVAMKRLVTRSRHPLLWVPEDDSAGSIPPLSPVS